MFHVGLAINQTQYLRRKTVYRLYAVNRAAPDEVWHLLRKVSKRRLVAENCSEQKQSHNKIRWTFIETK